MKKITSLLSIILVLTWITLPAFAEYETGDSAANFILDDAFFCSHSLFDYRGRIVVLNFFESG